MKRTSYKPKRDLVLIRETGTMSGLIIQNKPTIEFKDKQVVAIGPDVVGIEVGEFVHISGDAFGVSEAIFSDTQKKEDVFKQAGEDAKKDATRRSLDPSAIIPVRKYDIEAYFVMPYHQILGECNPSSEDPKVDTSKRIILPN